MYLQDALLCSRVKMAIYTDTNGIETMVQLRTKNGFTILTKPDSINLDEEYNMAVVLWLSDKWTPILP